MQSENVEGNLLEIIDLAHTLRQEQLFIQNEQQMFETLSETFSQNSSDIAQLAWIYAHQKQNLKNLIIARDDTTACCIRANRLENTKFIDAYKAKGLKYQHVISYIELFNFLYRSPYLLAQSLVAGDSISKITSEQMNTVINIIATGLYANAIHSKDVEVMLKLLRELIENQIVISDNPRKMLRPSSSAFGRLYNSLLEYLFSAKIFLTAALHEPIMKVLVESETMLDVDPNKAILNFTRKERLKRFGEETAADYNTNIQNYRTETIENLFQLANDFLQNLIQNWSLFPSTLRWLVQTMYHQLKHARINAKIINEILTDMVFTHFICPAIVSPDNLGISEAPISEQARFNLIQIGQIIQMLAVMKYEDVDPKFGDIYRKFDQNIVVNLLDQLLVSDNGEDSNGVVAIRSQQSDFERLHVLITQSELNCFVDFFRKILDNDELNISGDDRRKLGKILDNLPDKFENILNGSEESSPQNDNNSRAKQHLINLGKSTKSRLAKSMSLNVNTNENNNVVDDYCPSQNGHNVEEQEQVLVFPISIADENKLQLLTEEEVLKMNSIGQQEAALIEENLEKLDKVPNPDFKGQVVLRPSAKATRFSISHDDASIGNSDNLEAVSEAPSNHSVTSSLELEENDQNDNLSDMVSANVSGRGTPNISGRDTPSSQVTDGENTQQIPTPQMAKIINKARSDIEDKFCKFEIKKLIEGDETVSIISDTWSTDVLASDSETVDASDRDRNFSTPLIPSAVVLPGDNNFDVLSRPQVVGYLEETRSESAWSTDVLVSDSEKLTEVDTDDNLSITAKSDITDAGRSDVGGEAVDSQVLVHQPADSPRINFQTPDSPVYSIRSAAESPYFPNTNQYEDQNLCSSPVSSLARSSVRTTNQYSGENNFQQNYKSGGCTANERAYLSNNNRIRRQNSAESSISNQSFNLEDNNNINNNNNNNSNNNINNNNIKTLNVNVDKIKKERKNSKDLIDFDDYHQDGAIGITEHKVPDGEEVNMRTEDDYRGLYDKFSEEHVIHRRISSEQRNASFDGRRNGILDFKADARRHQSLNYENHEIIQMTNASSQRIVSTPINASITDDAKTEQKQQQQQLQQNFLIDEILLVQKTEVLDINESHINVTVEPSINIDIVEPIITNNGIKPSKSTGAIPKSISFDASADKTTSHSKRVQDPTRLNGTGFFNKIKQGFKNRRHNKSRLDEFNGMPSNSVRNVSFGLTDGGEINRENGGSSYNDTTEDILAKYRRKVSTSSETTNSDSTGNSSLNRKNSDMDPRLPNGIIADKAISFVHAKKKIRSVLSTTDLHTGDFRHTTYSHASPLITYLKIQLAQSLNLQNFDQISVISEAIRTLNSLDEQQNQKLIEELQSDIIKRQSYLQYLMRYRQNLLSTLKNIDQFEERLSSDRKTCNRHLISVCVKMFLEKREQAISRFQEGFCQLTVVDEKDDLLQEFIENLIGELKNNILFGVVVDWQLDAARISIERVLLHRLYKYVMFPNEDGDISRDQVLHEHIRKLQKIISPSHNALRIPQEYLSEAPWPFAQQQISYISAYKTAREKLQCVIRCISSIINLLLMGHNREPAADDILPVLIYVIIMANPPYLLSTIQYVNCFIGDELDGQHQFHWTQFCSVVQFIKTLDYLD